MLLNCLFSILMEKGLFRSNIFGEYNIQLWYMDNFKDLFQKQKSGEVLLTILFIVYILMGYKVPEPVASAVDSVVGKAVVVILAIALFSYTNPVLGVLGFYIAFDLIKRSSESTGTYALQKYVPTETKKECELNLYNQFPYTLEQEIVKILITKGRVAEADEITRRLANLKEIIKSDDTVY